MQTCTMCRYWDAAPGLDTCEACHLHPEHAQHPAYRKRKELQAIETELEGRGQLTDRVTDR